MDALGIYEIDGGIDGHRRFAVGRRGLRAYFVVDRLGRAQYRGVRGIKPVIGPGAKLLNDASTALKKALHLRLDAVPAGAA